MSDTRDLLLKISALRQRLEQAQGLVDEARSAAAALLDSPAPLAGTTSVETVLVQASDHDLAFDAAVRPFTAAPEEPKPRQLSARARRVLERGRELLIHLRGMADHFTPHSDDAPAPLQHLYRDTVALIDTTLRTVALLPDSTATQMQLCRGLEVALEEVADRLHVLVAGSTSRQRETGQVERLAALLQAIDEGQACDHDALLGLVDEVMAEVRECEPLRFLHADPADKPRFVACHSLTVARVVARVVRHAGELRDRPHDAVLAALLHDVGMLGMPDDLLTQAADLLPEQRRFLEAHPVVGAQLVGGLFADAAWLPEAIVAHHERLDGTGYPDGLQGNRIRPLARLLAVCDVYAAFCGHRPHRQARPTRTALADTLLLADQGSLDRDYAECCWRCRSTRSGRWWRWPTARSEWWSPLRVRAATCRTRPGRWWRC
ncbi:MAG: HD domain-containing phosphohydrolase [Gemmataceae bacterium]